MALRKSKSKSKSAIFICVAVAIIISVIVMLDYVSSSESDELLGQIELERERQLEKLNQLKKQWQQEREKQSKQENPSELEEQRQQEKLRQLEKQWRQEKLKQRQLQEKWQQEQEKQWQKPKKQRSLYKDKQSIKYLIQRLHEEGLLNKSEIGHDKGVYRISGKDGIFWNTKKSYIIEVLGKPSATEKGEDSVFWQWERRDGYIEFEIHTYGDATESLVYHISIGIE